MAKERTIEQVKAEIRGYERSVADPREWPHHREHSRRVLGDLHRELREIEAQSVDQP